MAEPITLRDEPLGSPAFPEITRIQELSRGQSQDGRSFHAATLHCHPFTSRFTWKGGPMDARIQEGSLVSIAWNASAVNSTGLQVARLISMDIPDKRINLFETVPKTWLDNRPLLERAGRLWAVLPFQFQHLFNAIFWEAERFKRYVTGPSSLQHHHNRPMGNLEHTLQVTELALGMARQIPRVSLPVLILAGLLHDGGKAEECRPTRTCSINWRRRTPDRGEAMIVSGGDPSWRCRTRWGLHRRMKSVFCQRMMERGARRMGNYSE